MVLQAISGEKFSSGVEYISVPVAILGEKSWPGVSL